MVMQSVAETPDLSGDSLHRRPSSLRTRAPEETLPVAQTMAARLGVTRVTDITRLDRIGTPVYSSVRPTAGWGSLCVNAGKGITPIDARVGATMEAIEFAVAESETHHKNVMMATPRDVIDGHRRPSAILDFCPIATRSFDLTAPLACMEADNIVCGTRTLVPAELALLPYVGKSGTGYFGSTSNGLASGNSPAEAILHGLFEVLERDARSFNNIKERAVRVVEATCPSLVLAEIDKVRSAGLDICIRFIPDDFGVPCFQAVLWDPMGEGGLALNGGYGSHLDPSIAVIRAVTEAIQSRLSWIHGSRDDLVDFPHGASPAELSHAFTGIANQFRRYTSANESIDFRELGTPDTPSTVPLALYSLLDRITSKGISDVCVVPLTAENEPLHVVKVIVPKLEHYDRGSQRVGIRLRSYIKSSHAT